MRRLETPPRGRSMVNMIKTLGERLSSVERPAVVEAEPAAAAVDRPAHPVQSTPIKSLQRR